ncbi:MAG: leucyl/phenylalanyl-tRNA--protein transferase [bacterium]
MTKKRYFPSTFVEVMTTPFPPVEYADENGLLAVGGPLNVQILEHAYRNGIFPWPAQGYPVLWFAPPKRAILEFHEFRIPKRLKRYLKNAHFQFKVDTDFVSVIRACAETDHRKSHGATWITQEMITAYIEFHKRGFARSFETYNEKNELVGGLYGVKIEHFFAGESMFHSESNASKFALIECVSYLQNSGLTWMDVQIHSSFLAGFGAKEIPRAVFMKKLQSVL